MKLSNLLKLSVVIGLLALGACGTVENQTPSEGQIMDIIPKELIDNPPTFELGDSYSFNNPDMTWNVIGINAGEVEWQNNSGDLQTTANNPLLPALEWASEKRGKGRRMISDMQGNFFPLTIGNQVLFKTTVNTDKPPYAWEFDWTCDFLSRQKITVPAGTFDTFKIDCYRQRPERWLFYYAPKIGYYVKMETNNAGNPMDIKIRELVSFNHHGKAGDEMMNAMASENAMMDASMQMMDETSTVEVETVEPMVEIVTPSVIETVPMSKVVKPVENVSASVPTKAVPASSTGYGMHVESYKNAKMIDAAWANLTKKYPNHLAGFQKIIKRVDLGSKGVFDRLIIGPVDSKKVAKDFCKALKSLGQKYCSPIKL